MTEMDNTIIDRWNTFVKDEDVVFHLGDFSFRDRAPRYFKKLKGHIILIKGNHDNHKDSIITELRIKHGGIDWHLVHHPLDSIHPNILCGHVHTAWKSKMINGRAAINVGTDMWGYTPITIESILKERKELFKSR